MEEVFQERQRLNPLDLAWSRNIEGVSEPGAE